MNFEEAVRLSRRHLWWIAPVVVLLVNVVVLSTYRSLYSGRVDALTEEISKERAQLGKLNDQAAQMRGLVTRAADAADGIGALYEDEFGTESEYFTSVVREIRDLALRAGVVPDRISYPEQLLEDYGLIKRSFVFAVTGSYRELRLFVNYLELSDYFLVLESLGLQESEEGLRIRVVASTLFSGRDRMLSSGDAVSGGG